MQTVIVVMQNDFVVCVLSDTHAVDSADIPEIVRACIRSGKIGSIAIDQPGGRRMYWHWDIYDVL